MKLGAGDVQYFHDIQISWDDFVDGTKFTLRMKFDVLLKHEVIRSYLLRMDNDWNAKLIWGGINHEKDFQVAWLTFIEQKGWIYLQPLHLNNTSIIFSLAGRGANAAWCNTFSLNEKRVT